MIIIYVTCLYIYGVHDIRQIYLLHPDTNSSAKFPLQHVSTCKLEAIMHKETLLLETVSGNNVSRKNYPETLLAVKGNDDIPQHHAIPT